MYAKYNRVVVTVEKFTKKVVKVWRWERSLSEIEVRVFVEDEQTVKDEV